MADRSDGNPLQVYASFLALVSVAARPRWSRLITKHLVIILLALFGVYLYRDVWPLSTFTKQPLDSHEGWLLWAKIIILAVISVIIPISIPRQYIPFDPKVYKCTRSHDFQC